MMSVAFADRGDRGGVRATRAVVLTFCRLYNESIFDTDTSRDVRPCCRLLDAGFLPLIIGRVDDYCTGDE